MHFGAILILPKRRWVIALDEDMNSSVGSQAPYFQNSIEVFPTLACLFKPHITAGEHREGSSPQLFFSVEVLNQLQKEKYEWQELNLRSNSQKAPVPTIK